MKTTKLLAIILPILVFLSVGVFYFIMMPREVWAFNSFDQSERLPEQSLNFIEERYPDVIVLNVEIDWDGYEAYLSNGVRVDFRFSGSARGIDIDRDDYYERNINVNRWVPTSSTPETREVETPVTILPDGILNYLEEQFPGISVIRAEKDYDGIEVYLANGLRVDFDDDGTVEVNQREE